MFFMKIRNRERKGTFPFASSKNKKFSIWWKRFFMKIKYREKKKAHFPSPLPRIKSLPLFDGRSCFFILARTHWTSIIQLFKRIARTPLKSCQSFPKRRQMLPCFKRMEISSVCAILIKISAETFQFTRIPVTFSNVSLMLQNFSQWGCSYSKLWIKYILE